MGSIYKKDGQYFIEFYARGLLYRKNVKGNRDQAEEALREIEAQIAHGESQAVDPEFLIVDFFNLFREYIQSSQYAQTVIVYESFLKHFEGFLNIKHSSLVKSSELTPYIVEDYRGFLERDSSVFTSDNLANIYLGLLEDAFEFAIRLGVLNDNPTIHTPYFDREGASLVDLPEGLLDKLSPEEKIAFNSSSQGNEGSKNIKFVNFHKMLDIADICQSAQYYRFVKTLPNSSFSY